MKVETVIAGELTLPRSFGENMNPLIVRACIGPVGCGKTTFIEQNFSAEKYVRVRMGFVLRDMIGTGAMAATENPNAPDLTEGVVKQFLMQGVRLALDMKRELVLDGHPRSVEQAKWLFGWMQGLQPQKFHMVLHCFDRSLEEQEERLRKRSGGEIDPFDLVRLRRSRLDFMDTVEFCKTKHQSFPNTVETKWERTASS
jgi:adenylate kinase family enzyme